MFANLDLIVGLHMAFVLECQKFINNIILFIHFCLSYVQRCVTMQINFVVFDLLLVQRKILHNEVRRPSLA